MASEEPEPAAAAAAAAAPSPLEKPLKDLTEEDIAQLTREDWRRFLKQKGMRRPSWNKSQAMQQVISLKTLLEGPPSDDTPLSSASPSTPASAAATNHPPPPPPGDLEPPSDASGEPPAEGGNISPSKFALDDREVGQMTIFYCGKVNVYEGIHPDKAKAVMQLAGSPIHSPSGTATELLPVAQPLTPFQTTSYTNMTSSSPISNTTGKRIQIMEDLKSSHDNDYDGPTSREASLQRYLDKRKDRLDLSKRHMRL